MRTSFGPVGESELEALRRYNEQKATSLDRAHDEIAKLRAQLATLRGLKITGFDRVAKSTLREEHTRILLDVPDDWKVITIGTTLGECLDLVKDGK